MALTTTVVATPATARVLVVDDERQIAESLASFLVKKSGYHVSVAHDGQTAMEILDHTAGTPDEIDLVLLDVRMPVMSGLEVLAWIREHPDLNHTRVVLLTAASGSQEKVKALSVGADDYITKPYHPQELLARTQTILRTQQLEKQLQQQSEQLAALNRVGQTVSASLETPEVLAAAARGTDEVLHVELVSIYLLESGQLRNRHTWYRPDVGPLAAPAVVAVDQGLLGHVFSQATTEIRNAPHDDPRFEPESDIPAGFNLRSLIAGPLVVRGRPVGVLVAYNKVSGEFSEVDQALFASLASSVAEAIENAWLFQRIRLRQQELLEGKNTLQALIDGIPNPIYTINDEWQLVAVNKSKADELGAAPEALIAETAGQTCYQTFFQRESPCEHCLAARTLAAKQAQNWAVSWLGPDHLPREWDVNAYPIPSLQASSARAVIVWQDRTDERRLEASLMQAGKLAAIGQLAAGVAHEINNPLTAINANAQMLKMLLAEEDENYEAVDLIGRAGERAATVVRGLLDFARQETYAFEADDINRSILQAIDLVRYQLQTADVEVVLNLDEELPRIVASWEHMKSVWLNLIINARDAVLYVPAGRQIEIVTQLAPDEQYLLALFRDNGKGMSLAETEHIFEPFYTTKDPGQGTGLGLATCHQIIEQHAGEINVVSAPNEGTTFIVRLPLPPAERADDA